MDFICIFLSWNYSTYCKEALDRIDDHTQRLTLFFSQVVWVWKSFTRPDFAKEKVLDERLIGSCSLLWLLRWLRFCWCRQASMWNSNHGKKFIKFVLIITKCDATRFESSRVKRAEKNKSKISKINSGNAEIFSLSRFNPITKKSHASSEIFSSSLFAYVNCLYSSLRSESRELWK